MSKNRVLLILDEFIPMGWRGALRAIEAAERRAQRDAQRRYKELQRRAKEHAKLSALEQARLEVETYENQVEVLLSMHKEQANEWNWEHVSNTRRPLNPFATIVMKQKSRLAERLTSQAFSTSCPP